ncbi:hypothetical protein ACFYW6_31300 [Streptomyces sp. NPDC002659]
MLTIQRFDFFGVDAEGSPETPSRAADRTLTATGQELTTQQRGAAVP